MNRDWNILCWNVRGINDDSKWKSIRNKIEESACNIFVCKKLREFFGLHYVRNFAPKRFDKFDFYPSKGASGGIIVIWMSSVFAAVTMEKHSFAIRVQFTSLMNIGSWTLVYGPSHGPSRVDFVNWLTDLDIGIDDCWIILGDFNFYRHDENRNKPSGNNNDMATFNNIINHLGLIKLPLKGRSYTWSNMQSSPLLE